jgi:uncharacterized membrane protein YgcG
VRNIDFTSWQSIVTTLVGLALVTLIGMGIRLVVQMTIQQGRERLNRQINERLRTLIAAYKVLGGSFTGNLAVDPAHKRDLRHAPAPEPATDLEVPDEEAGPTGASASDRHRRIRDAVEAALSDIILLGTEEHVRLAERAARELVGGHPVHTQELVVALRNFIRDAIDLDPIPADLAIPMQGPTRPSSASGRGKGGDTGRDGARQGGGTGGGGGGMAGGIGIGVGAGKPHEDPLSPDDRPAT